MSNGQPPRSESLSSPEGASPGPRRARFSRSWPERLLLSFGVIVTTLSVLAAGVLAWGLKQFEDIETVDISTVEQAAPGEPANWLLVGTDSREGIDADDPDAGVFVGGDPSELPSGKRTDTMLVARVNPKGQVIDLLSIPRDLYVPIAGTGTEGRINAAFNAENGEQRLVDTIESYLKIEINHYAEINFVGFQDIVEELGGVPMWFDTPMRDGNSGLDVPNAGCQTLDGFQSLAFARSRHLQYFEDGQWTTDPTGDLGRTSRQQYFLRRVVDTAASQVDFTSIGKINSIITVGGSNLVIDRGVEPGDLLQLAKTFADLRGDQIVGHSLPVVDFRTADGAAVLGLQLAEAQPTLDIFRGLVPVPDASAPEEAPISLTATVLNASGVAGQAGSIGDALAAEGFEIVEVGNAEPRTETVVRFSSGQADAAAVLISHLASDPSTEIDEDLQSVVLVVGSGFVGMADSQRSITALDVPAPTTTPTPPTTEPIGVVPGPSPEGTACS